MQSGYGETLANTLGALDRVESALDGHDIMEAREALQDAWVELKAAQNTQNSPSA